jgi:hypothetical protein
MAEHDDSKAEATEGESSEEQKGAAEESAKAGADASAPAPSEAFRQGLDLLWQAARGTADEIKREVDKGGVGDALKQAGRDLEVAANAAAKTLEGFIERVGPHGDHKPYKWPGASGSASAEPKKDDEEGDAEKGDDKRVEPGDPVKDGEDGGTTEDGERRDMRIQVEDDD